MKQFIGYPTHLCERRRQYTTWRASQGADLTEKWAGYNSQNPGLTEMVEYTRPARHHRLVIPVWEGDTRSLSNPLADPLCYFTVS